MWKQQQINLGELKAKDKYEVVFEHEGDITVKNIVAGCACTVSKWNPETNQLHITYTPGKLPYHLKQIGRKSYNAIKRVVVNSEKSSDILTFTAQVND